ncbi:TPA: environmental stress-induced protein Ves, partial [Escherichia coli]
MEYFDMRKMSVNLWRNAAGETREICTFPPAKRDFYWRASITSIAANGEFSLFPGMERIVTLLEGGEMFLESADRFNHTLKPLQPFSFAADLVVKAKLTAGQMSMDFNIMTRLDVCKAKVRIAERTFTTFGSRGGVVFVINGAWQLGDKLL